jgi:hypothetical protein
MPSATATRPWLNWYGQARWAGPRGRARYQLAIEPLCRMCSAEGKITVATVVDHVQPHRGNYKLFWFSELQSLCARHHSRDKAQLERQGFVNDIGKDGWPLDPNHPINKLK